MGFWTRLGEVLTPRGRGYSSSDRSVDDLRPPQRGTLPPLHGGYRPQATATRPRITPPTPPRPFPPYTRLPDPGVRTDGSVACNEPLPGVEGVYCSIFVKRNPDGSRRPHRRKPHRYEWGTRA